MVGKTAPAPMISKLDRRWLCASGAAPTAHIAKAITAIQMILPLIVIHQKISAMRSAPSPAGSRADCGPVQPVSQDMHARRIDRPAAQPTREHLWLMR